MLEDGDKAELTATAVGGETFDFSNPGKALVVFFYPRDNTPGCTTEAKDFTDLANDFAHAGARIVGVSRDSEKSHEKFTAKHDLKIPLIADEDGAVSDAFGTWGEKKNYGRTYMGMHRATFVIGADGTIQRAWPKVRVKGHADEVLAYLRSTD